MAEIPGSAPPPPPNDQPPPTEAREKPTKPILEELKNILWSNLPDGEHPQNIDGLLTDWHHTKEDNYSKFLSLLDTAKTQKIDPAELRPIIIPPLQRALEQVNIQIYGFNPTTQILLDVFGRIDLGPDLLKVPSGDYSEIHERSIRQNLETLTAISVLKVFGHTVTTNYYQTHGEYIRGLKPVPARTGEVDLQQSVQRVKDLIDVLKSVGIDYKPSDSKEGKWSEDWIQYSEKYILDLVLENTILRKIEAIPSENAEEYIRAEIFPLVEAGNLVGLLDFENRNISRTFNTIYRNREGLGPLADKLIQKYIGRLADGKLSPNGILSTLAGIDPDVRESLFREDRPEVAAAQEVARSYLQRVLEDARFNTNSRIPDVMGESLTNLYVAIRIAQYTQVEPPQNMFTQKQLEEFSKYIKNQYSFYIQGMQRLDAVSETSPQMMSLENNTLPTISLITEFAGLPPSFTDRLKADAFFAQSYMNERPGVYDKLGLPADFQQLKALMPVHIRSITDSWGLDSIQSVFDFKGAHKDYLDFISLPPDEPALLTPSDVELLPKCHINMVQAETAKRLGVDIPTLAGPRNEEEYKKLLEAIGGGMFQGSDQMLYGIMRMGGEALGYSKMFAYIDKEGISIHDALHEFAAIVQLYEASGLTPDQFYGNILNQVKMDDSEYNSGTAYHHLNQIASSIDTNFKHVIDLVSRYPNIPRLAELGGFLTKEAIFSNWNSLKRYAELSTLVERVEILDELAALGNSNEKLNQYVTTLLFHPTSKISMSSVTRFWRNPESFLADSATHVPAEVQDRKKPSNYIHMPNLDLTATELRDALIEGRMDGLQAFPAFEITYQVSDQPQTELASRVKTALGSRREGIAGKAQDPTKLFAEVSKVLKNSSISLQDYLAGGVSLEPAAAKQIEDILYHPDFGIIRPRENTQTYVAKIFQKSDPEGVLAGNDTACCMPFGDGKNTVYTFNPDTAQFVIQQARPDGTRRTIAQSVLTKDRDISKSIPEVIKEMENGKQNLAEVLPDDVLMERPTVLACDNVEVAPNYRKEPYAGVLEDIYRDFFKEYIARYGQPRGIANDRVIIGTGYTDALNQLPRIPNTYAPLAPVSYSDKSGPNVYALDLAQTGSNHIVQKTVGELVPQERAYDAPLPAIPGLQYATFEDTIPVSYIEGKAYADNPTLMEYLHNMENALIAKDINNAAKDRPNMSLKYVDNTGRVKGYLLAYEGRLNDRGASDERPEDADKPVIYVSDLASDGTNPLAGGRLIQGFVNIYYQNYVLRGLDTPIFTQAREGTSYRILQRNLQTIGDRLGLVFDMDELRTYQSGTDTMHPVIIRPRRKTPEELAAVA